MEDITFRFTIPDTPMRRISTQKMSVGQYRTHVRSIVANARASDLIMERFATYKTGLSDLDAVEETLDQFVEQSTTFDDLRIRRDRVSETFLQRQDAFRRGPFRTATRHAEYVFRGDADARDMLKLDDGPGTLDPRFPEWYPVAADFVQAFTDHPALRRRMITGPFTEADFDHLVDELAALDGLYQEREQLTAERQVARRKRDEARAATDEALSNVQDLGLLVLPDVPDLMEQLGCIVPSEA